MISHRIHIVIKSASPTEEDKKAVEHITDRITYICGGQHFKCKQSERIACTRMINLTNRKDIDEFYKDVIIELPKAKEEVKAPVTADVVKEIEKELPTLPEVEEKVKSSKPQKKKSNK